jgi:cell wall-associated NlpC family hydrolase
MHWVDQYVGRPWVSGAQGPSSFDCWGFVRHVSREVFDRELPEFAVDADDLRACMATFRDQTWQSSWLRVTHPVDGDIALLANGRYASHCGLFVKIDGAGGAIAHCERGCGVVVASRRRLPWQNIRFYRWAGA